MSKPKIYMAGPDVFLDPELRDYVVRSKKSILKSMGLIGVDPLDNALELKGVMPKEQGLAIYRANVKLIESCDGGIVNLTPFRGPSADAGTVFELGYLRALGKPMAAYTLSNRNYEERVQRHPKHVKYDVNLHEVESFCQADNLMLESALIDGGYPLVRAVMPSPPDELFEVGVFTETAEALSQLLGKSCG